MTECKCKECSHLRGIRRTGNFRTAYYCEHPNQKYITDWFLSHKIQKMPGFLDYGKEQLPLKRTPRWCPILMKEREALHGKDL